ncbi:methionyl-tRNA formyltransferase [Flavisphingomonas formosensis]|uniref:methionyl-tRNA formyltransferase n=1 Tax=Flavisphingomonas formosensis TaxID=861534 RepID=UPI0012FC2CA0|nr:methionyl-tRNA formyltransferase [Sphingomonas formosensis]
MRIAFMGTPDFAVPTLDALAAAGHDLAAVYCQPPRPAGRGKALMPSPVQKRAEALGIPVRTPLSLKGEAEQTAFAALALDVAVVAAYGLILPQAILDAPRHGCINVHASLLPRWRGAAPIHRAILAGDAETGVTIMQMERGLDTGPMLRVDRCPIDRQTGGTLTAALAHMGARLMVETLAELDRITPQPQPEEGVTYAAKIAKAEARLDFAAGALQAERQVRAFNPAPGAFFEWQGERIKLLAAEVEPGTGEPGTVTDDALGIACGDGILRPTLVQRAGRGAMTPADLLRGFAIPAGAHLS